MTQLKKPTALLFLSSAAWAAAVGPPCKPGEPGRGGLIAEHSRFQNTNFRVHMTDLNGMDIGQSIQLTATNAAGGGSVAQYNQPLGVPGVCDAWNETVLPPMSGKGAGSGASSGLFLEAFLLDSISHQYVMYDIWDTIGTLGILRIPDFYADINGDGIPDNSGVLFGLINLATFNPIPSFTFGDQINIVNGTAPGLDIFFSTTRPVFNPATGFTGTPYTGNAVVETDHAFVPEPGTFAPVIGALVLITAARWRRRAHGVQDNEISKLAG